MSGRAPKAVVIGVGAAGGLGGALARKFAAEGRHVLVAGRTLEKVSRVAARIEEDGGSATAVQTDATSAEDVGVLFDLALRDDDLGAPADLVAFSVGNNMPRSRLEVTPEVFEKFWRTNCLAGFLVAREAAARFAPLGRGGLRPLRFQQGGAENDRPVHGAGIRSQGHPRRPCHH
ncbi:MAG: SDR family NAD(P)-dependent oxidoreductase [Phenylobacterium sp.]